MNYNFQLYQTVSELPDNWNLVVASKNILLSKEYFQVLEMSNPKNMTCFFGGFYFGEELIGGCLFQYLDFQKHNTQQGNAIIFRIRNFITKILVKNMLVLGNNMLTGQNAFYFNEVRISPEKAASILENAIQEIQKQIKKSSLITIKDFDKSQIIDFKHKIFKSYFKFSVQPNMVLNLRKYWVNFEDYKVDLSKKYRIRANSARKKLEGIEKRELHLEDLKLNSSLLHSLYQNVAENATINTFFLPEDHFAIFKKNLEENFRVFGYFLNDEIIGFYTLILNENNIDTYFLGYDKTLQKEKQLYLNMLLDMVEFGITQKFSTLIFGRTALEIKSTIGAEPVEIFGLIKHQNMNINKLMSKIFPAIEPKAEWIQRKPFKED